MHDQNGRDPAIEQFLTRLGRQLTRLPQNRREEELQEVEQHLGMLVDAYRHQGAADPVAAALGRFGNAERLGQDLRRQHARQSSPARYLRFYAWFAPVTFAAGLAFAWSIGAPISWQWPLPVPVAVIINALVTPAILILVDRSNRRRRATAA